LPLEGLVRVYAELGDEENASAYRQILEERKKS